MSQDVVVVLSVLLAAALILAPAALLLWKTRIQLRVTVLDPQGRPLAGARVVAHSSRSTGGYVNANDYVVERSSVPVPRGLGQTDASGVLETTLLLTKPWAVHAEGPDGACAPRHLTVDPWGGPVEVTLRLQGRPKG